MPDRIQRSRFNQSPLPVQHHDYVQTGEHFLGGYRARPRPDWRRHPHRQRRHRPRHRDAADYGPWQQAARDRGFRSTLTLPLRQDGRSFGALMIYADQPDRFDESETRLLCLLADDLAFGISALRNAVHRTHLAAVLNCAGDAIISVKFSGVITSWNKAAEDLFGHTAAEAIGSPIKIVVPPDLTEEFESYLNDFNAASRSKITTQFG